MPRLTRTLQQEAAPWHRLVAPAASRRPNDQEVIENPDPTLIYVAQDTERVYRAMEESSMAVAAAKEERISQLLSVNTGLERGTSSSARSRDIHRWTIAVLKNLYMFPQTLEHMMEGIFWGWRPLEKVWGEMRWEGKSYFVPKALKEKHPEHFRFTPTGAFVYRPHGKVEQSWSGRALALKWVIATSGSLDNPYGKALYRNVYLPWFVLNRFNELFGQGMERSVGMPKYTRNTTTIPGARGGPDMDGNTAMDQAIQEAITMMEYLHSDNVLVSLDGWEVDFITDLQAVEGWVRALEHVEDRIMVRISGANVTSGSTGNNGGGTRAEKQVLRTKQRDFAKKDAGLLQGWMNEQVLKPAIEWNWPDVQPDEMPRWRSLIHYDLEVEELVSFYEMGAPIDGKRAAQIHGVPLLLHPEDEDDPVLLQQGKEIDGEDKAPIALPGDEGGPDQTTAPDQDRGREEDSPDPKQQERKQSSPSAWDEVELSRAS